MYGIELQINDDPPLIGWSKTNGLFAFLALFDDGGLQLRITVKEDESSADKDYWFWPLEGGDRIRMTYRISEEAGDSTFETCGEREDEDDVPVKCPQGLRWGLDFTFVPRDPSARTLDPKTVRLSYPMGGSFRLFWGNIPRDHARCFVMAGTETEKWHWQLPDSHDGDSIELRVVQTDWNTPFPKVFKV